jgi:hypothetical protein
MEKIEFWSGLIGDDRHKLKDLFIEDEKTFNVEKHELVPIKELSFDFNIVMEKLSNEKMKKALSGLSKSEKLEKIDILSNAINFQDKNSWGRILIGFKIKNLRYQIIFKGDVRLTVDDVLEILGLKLLDLPKSFWRGVIQDLNLSSSSKSLLMEIMENDRIEIFRVIGAQGTQFTKEELKKIVSFPSFLKKTRSGIIGGSETVDIVNRRAVILHQDSADEEIVMEIINSFKSSEVDEKERFFKTLGKKSVVEKYKNSPSIQVLLKLR